MPQVQEPPIFWKGEEKEHIRKVALILRQVLAGKTNNVFDITLSANTTQTLVERERVNIDTKVTLIPKSASAASALSSLWITVSFGRITINHDSQSDTDRTFGATVVG